MVKPDMSGIKTFPNPYIENETYVPVEPDWSDIMETIEKVLDNYKDYQYIPIRFREEFKKAYTIDNLCLHWYEIFNSLDTITNEE